MVVYRSRVAPDGFISILNKSGDQTGADMDRVNEALKYFDLVYCEMKPGTALFVIPTCYIGRMRSQSDPRWSLICCYNAARNPCKARANHPAYSYLEKWSDERIKKLAEDSSEFSHE
jgi:hypothetical protein